MSGAEEFPTLRASTEAEAEVKARVSRRDRIYKINEFGRAAVAKFLEPDYAFSVSDLGPNDRVTVTVTVTVTVAGDTTSNGTYQAHLDLPAWMLEEI